MNFHRSEISTVKILKSNKPIKFYRLKKSKNVSELQVF